MPFTVRSGTRVFWRLEGASNNPPVVFLHGIGTGLSLFSRVVPLLIEDFRLLRIDLRGHGASDAPRGDYAMDDLARDVLAVMDDAGFDRVTICGLSLGGMVAMSCALVAPDRVDGLVLACTSASMSGGFWPERIEIVRERGIAAIADVTIERQYSPSFRNTHPEWVESSRHTVATMSADGYAGCGAAIRDMNLFDRLHTIRVPTLVVAGTQDPAAPFENHGVHIANAITGAETLLLDCGHLAAIENPCAFADAVRTVARPGGVMAPATVNADG